MQRPSTHRSSDGPSRASRGCAKDNYANRLHHVDGDASTFACVLHYAMYLDLPDLKTYLVAYLAKSLDENPSELRNTLAFSGDPFGFAPTLVKNEFGRSLARRSHDEDRGRRRPGKGGSSLPRGCLPGENRVLRSAQVQVNLFPHWHRDPRK